MKRFLVSISLFLIAFSCKETPPEPPPYIRSINLTVEDTSCIEAWLKLTLTSVSPPQTIQLKRDNQLVQTVQLATPDSIVVDTGLAPHRTYTYKAYRQSDSRLIDSSTVLPVTTMDTTSHNFTWQVDTLGDGNSSVLYDVTIINDTLAYAVGAIYLRGSSGNWDPNAYNLVRWNGHTWELMRIQFLTFCGQTGTGSYPAKSIFAFSASDIWIGMDGSQVVRCNGQNQSVPVCIPVSVNKLWGTSSNNLYAVGYGGGIAHYASGTWQRVESGTTIDLRDVWGSSDGSGVWACGYRNDYSASVLLQYAEQHWRQVIEVPISSPPRQDTLSGSIASIWMSAARGATAATSGGIYRVPFTSHGEARRTWYPNVAEVGFFHRVRGSELNNVIVVGAFGTVAHFNGAGWKVFPQFQASGRLFLSTSINSRNVMICGYDGARAIIVRGVPQ
jgi:hypothetical protein